jgi:hypothetical protein
MVDWRFRVGLAILVLCVFCVGAYLGLYAYSASKVEVRQVRLTGLYNVSLEGAVFKGVVEVYNGGLIPVSVESIDYRLSVGEGGLELVEGRIMGGIIPVGESADYEITAGFSWAPTAEAAFAFLTGDDSALLLDGTVHVGRIGFSDLRIPFTRRIEVKEHLNEFIRGQLEKSLPEDLAQKLPDNLVEKAGELLKRLAGRAG